MKLFCFHKEKKQHPLMEETGAEANRRIMKCPLSIQLSQGRFEEQDGQSHDEPRTTLDQGSLLPNSLVELLG